MALIIFASERGHGADFATHLLNAQDNEFVEFLSVRGSISDDLHGIFNEWETQGQTLTNANNTFFQLVINPQDPTDLELVNEWLGRYEEKLGLTQQPRTVVRHVKEGREHFHAAYSRILVEQEKALAMSFYKEKTMQVTREIARDYGLTLPDGYYKDKGQHEGKGQLLMHEKVQQDHTGISKEERMAAVTTLWQQSDSAKAFVAGLEEHGYTLCRGKRPYVLVDYYGNMNALPRLIDDKQVRTKDIERFLEKDFPVDRLPDVEETRSQIATLRDKEELVNFNQVQAEKLQQLTLRQEQRRASLLLSQSELKARQESEWLIKETEQFSGRASLRSNYLEAKKQIRDLRDDHRPQGIAAVLAKVSGFAYAQRRLQRYQDHKRYEGYASDKEALLTTQRAQGDELNFQHLAQRRDLDGRARALALIDHRELLALNRQHLKTQRIEFRKGHVHAPRVALELTPPSRLPMIHKAKQLHNPTLDDLKPKPLTKTQSPDARAAFAADSAQKDEPLTLDAPNMQAAFLEERENSALGRLNNNITPSFNDELGSDDDDEDSIALPFDGLDDASGQEEECSVDDAVHSERKLDGSDELDKGKDNDKGRKR